ncbi:MAG: hypothetical protein Q9227_001508 [Pyrenula ochraceoflavens]
MPDLPSHASPLLAPHARPSAPFLRDWDHDLTGDNGPPTPAVPGTFLSPACTPPSTPGISSGVSTPSHSQREAREPKSVPVDTSVGLLEKKAPRLLEELPQVECVVRARIPTVTGAEMFLHVYKNNVDHKEHLAIVFGMSIRSASLDRAIPGETERERMARGAYYGRLRPGRVDSKFDEQMGDVKKANGAGSSDHVEEEGHLNQVNGADCHQTSEDSQPPLVRIHSECYTGETVWSARCDCGEQLDEAARLMSMPSTVNGSGGVIVYLRQEGRGIGLAEKLKAYNLQDLGSDTVEANLLLRHPADARSYGLATAILLDLGCGGERGIRLLTNNPDKIRAVEGPKREIRVRERVPMVPLAWRTHGKNGIKSDEIENYLSTKIGKMGHLLAK